MNHSPKQTIPEPALFEHFINHLGSFKIIKKLLLEHSYMSLDEYPQHHVIHFCLNLKVCHSFRAKKINGIMAETRSHRK